jgi:hypothetical protein
VLPKDGGIALKISDILVVDWRRSTRVTDGGSFARTAADDFPKATLRVRNMRFRRNTTVGARW